MGFKDEYGMEDDLGSYGQDESQSEQMPMTKGRSTMKPLSAKPTMGSVKQEPGVTVVTKEMSVKEM